ncbi:MAG TPA: glycosyltransferase family 4 protein, partial [Cyclobacteriaceae bacterium]|nr:glycosyltransferase family 4 protein [Cyclobacteriaceae bacterium]
MKVVILHQHFKIPARGGAIRSWYLARAGVEAGHDVTVLSGHNGDYKREAVDGIEVHWLPVAYDNRFDFSDRSKSFLRYIWQVIRRPALYRDADVCYAISVPLTTGIAAMWIRRRYGLPYVFEVGDLWPDAPVELGFIRNRWLKNILFALEEKTYAHAHSVVALSEPIRTAIEKKTSNKAIEVIPNMADTDYYYPSNGDPVTARKYGLEGRFVVSYVGAVGYANGLDYILQCATVCQARK